MIFSNILIHEIGALKIDSTTGIMDSLNENSFFLKQKFRSNNFGIEKKEEKLFNWIELLPGAVIILCLLCTKDVNLWIDVNRR